MRLAPLLSLGIPELNGGKASSGHAKICSIKDVTSLAIDVGSAISKAKDFQCRELTA